MSGTNAFAAEVLGHVSIVTTMIYAHLAPHVARDAVQVLDRARVLGAVPSAAPNSPPTSTRSGDPRRGGEGLAKVGRRARNQLRS